GFYNGGVHSSWNRARFFRGGEMRPHPLWLLLVEDENGKLQDGDLSADQQRPAADASRCLEFPDGTCVLLTDLREGQEATVLQLPAQPKTPAEEAAQRRAIYVG